LIVADGFYEWMKRGRQKQPFYIRLKDDRPFAFAGLWEHWHRNDLSIDSCTILTTDANELVQVVHDRMPVIVHPRDYAHWLDPAVQDAAALAPLLIPYPADEMQAFAVSTQVNKPGYDSAECIEPERYEQAPPAASEQRTLW
jgi:putative SOS response-associated peptidase YedK